jgi:hypothetical protein
MSEPARHPDQDALREQIRAELEAEHQRRLERFQERRSRAHDSSRAHQETRLRKAEEDLRQSERRRFYQEQGYKEYVDSNGRAEWLPPQEYEWRMRRRKKRDRKGREYQPSVLTRRRELALYAVAAVIAVILGLILIR